MREVPNNPITTIDDKGTAESPFPEPSIINSDISPLLYFDSRKLDQA
jgi:hypothetical protein